MCVAKVVCLIYLCSVVAGGCKYISMSDMDKFMNMLFSDSLISPTNSPLSTHTLSLSFPFLLLILELL